MKVKDVCRLFEEVAPPSMGTQGDRDNRVLELRFGDYQAEVTGVGVAWYLSMEVIEKAIEAGLNFLLIHEPGVFFTNPGGFSKPTAADTFPGNLNKKRLLLKHGISVYTAHSNWDLQPEVGMRPTLSKALGFTDLIEVDQAVGIYRIETVPFSELVAHVKKSLGLKHIRARASDPARPISSVALGWGGMGPGIDSGIFYETDASIFGELNEYFFRMAREVDMPLIEMTHRGSESEGFSSVAEVMRDKIPGMKIEFLEMSVPWEII